MKANTKPLNGNLDNEECRIRTITKIPLDDVPEPAEFISFHALPDDTEHVVIAFGDWRNVEVPLVRLHSECLTGDIFGSQKCDCGAQLKEAVSRIYAEGGFLIYLRQEGRGIGLYNKLDAYNLQNQGQDTYQANNNLGFDDDLRDYRSAAEMLKALQKTKINLLSNNLDKKSQLEKYGINIDNRFSTGVYRNVHNENYLQTKAQFAKHDICLEKSLT